MYLIDSDILISFSRARVDLQERFIRSGMSSITVSEISLAEMLVGAYKCGKETEFLQIQRIRALFECVPLTYAIIDEYARIRAALEATGSRLETMDLLIAATALANDYTLVTHNTRHFARIPGLKLEDWLED